MLITAATLADGRTRDVRVTDGEIAAVAENLTPASDETVVDATDHHLLPGAIDVHVHFRQPGFDHKEDWRTGSRSAAAGGVTTVVDQPNTEPATTTGEAFDRKADLAESSLVNYGINGGVTADWDPDSLFDRPLFALGEVFLADSTGDMGIDTELFADALDRAADADVPVTVHAEDADLFDESSLSGGDIDTATGHAAPSDRWSQYRRAEAEIAAVEQALDTARDAGASVHIAHTSTPEAVDAVAEADTTTTDDRKFTCEVTPHHLFLSRADCSVLGTFGRMNPPLRSPERRDELFERVRDGTVDVVATDHAPHTTAEKEATLREAPSGVPGVETMLPLLLAEVHAGRLELDRVRDLVATNPADIFDLPEKGSVESGADADLVLVNLDETREIRGERLHSNCEWTPFEGETGVFPTLTLVGGEIVYDGRGAGAPFGDGATGADGDGATGADGDDAVGENVR
jgi:dihydroorotase